MNAYETAAKYMAIIQKAGARHSAKDTDLVQQMHDRACELGAKCNCEEVTVHPTLRAAVEVLILRHPGHGNQKTHGNRFGAGQAKESLRRLKDDKGAREQYKAKARGRAEKIRKELRKDVDTQLAINKLGDRESLLQRQIDTENLKPKYRKEKQAEIVKLRQQINEIKRTKVRSGSFVKHQGTSVTGLVTGRGTIKVGKESVPVFKVKLPGGKQGLIPVRDSQVVAL